MPWYPPSNTVLALGSLLWSREHQLGVWTKGPVFDHAEVLGNQAGSGRMAVPVSAASLLRLRKSRAWKWLSWPLSQCVRVNPASASARCMVLIRSSFLRVNAYEQSHSGGKIHVIDFLLAVCSHSLVEVNALWWFRLKWAVAQWSAYTCKCSMKFGVLSVQKVGMIVKPFLKF